VTGVQTCALPISEIAGIPVAAWDLDFVKELIGEALETRKWIFSEIAASRTKDYQNPFKQMVYSSYEEMEEVVGALADNDFINRERLALQEFEATVTGILAAIDGR